MGEHRDMSTQEVTKNTGRWTSETAPRGFGSRPKIIREVRNLARAWTMEALSTIKFIMDDERQGGAVRLAAANAILDRAWGKPESSVNLAYEGTQDVEKLTTNEIKRLLLESINKVSCEEAVTVEGEFSERKNV